MDIKELDRKIEDSLLQVVKCLFLDVIFSICLLKIHRIEGIVVFFPILLCTVVATYSWIDKISYMKRQKQELQELEE